MTMLAPEVDELIEQLGGSVETFRPSRANLIAGLILGGLAGAAGLALIGFQVREVVLNGGNLPVNTDVKFQSSWISVGLASLIGLVLFGVGVGVVWFVRGLFGARVVVCRDGFVQDLGGARVACRWGEIAEVQEHVAREHFPLKGVAKYAVPMGKSRSYLVRRQDGTEFAYTGNTVQKVVRLGKMIQDEAGKRGVPCRIVEVSG
jgi:hypothetical protein